MQNIGLYLWGERHDEDTDKTYDNFHNIFLTADTLAIKAGMEVHYFKSQCFVFKFKVKVAAKVQNMNICLDDILYISDHNLSKLGMVIHRYEL